MFIEGWPSQSSNSSPRFLWRLKPSYLNTGVKNICCRLDRGCGASPAAACEIETERDGFNSTWPLVSDPLRLGFRHSRGPAFEKLRCVSCLLRGLFYGFTDHFFEFSDALVERSGDGENERFADATFEFLQIFFGGRLIHFVGDDEARFFQQAGIVEFEFLEQVLIILPRRTIVRAGHVEQQHQDFAALDVAQKLVSKTHVAMRAFDQSRHVAYS